MHRIEIEKQLSGLVFSDVKTVDDFDTSVHAAGYCQFFDFVILVDKVVGKWMEFAKNVEALVRSVANDQTHLSVMTNIQGRYAQRFAYPVDEFQEVVGFLGGCNSLPLAIAVIVFVNFHPVDSNVNRLILIC